MPKSGEPQAPVRLVADAMSAIRNADAAYSTWIRFGYAAYRATGGGPEGFDIWNAWSQKSRKYDASETEAAWKRIGHAIEGSTAPRTIGAGTIFFEAKAAGWTRPDAHVPSDKSRRNQTAATSRLPGDEIQIVPAPSARSRKSHPARGPMAISLCSAPRR